MSHKRQAGVRVTGKAATVVYDGDCPMCSSFRDWVRERDRRGDLEFVPSQSERLADLAPGVDRAEAGRSMALAAPDGHVFYASRAMAEVLKRLGLPWKIFGRLISVPPFNILASPIYRVIANNRYRLTGHSR